MTVFPHFRCVSCGCESDEPFSQRCRACGGILEARPPVDPTDAIAGWEGNAGLWRYASSLCVDRAARRVTLGEGRTPLVEVPALAAKVGLRRLALKLELVNPTGSFKDRALSAVVTHASRHRARGLVGSSSGNALHAQAAYAALAGMASLALVPEAVPMARLAQPIRCGTHVVRVRGDYSACHALARAVATSSGWYNVSTTYENPVGADAYKTVAYELAESDARGLDWICVPVGAGPLLGAISRGYEDLVAGGYCPRFPALLGVQASNCAPIARAYQVDVPQVKEWDGPASSIARGIADPLRGYAQDGTYTLSAVVRSRGAVVAVSEDEIAAAMDLLARHCGLYVDPAAAAGLAGLAQAVRARIVPHTASVAAIITGTGFKENPLDPGAGELNSIFDPSLDALDSILPQGGCT